MRSSWPASGPTTTPPPSTAWPTSSSACATSRDAEGRTNLAIADVGGAFLVVSQFTLYADVSRGRRPGFTRAALPEQAVPLVDRLVERLRDAGAPVQTGRFGAEMQVELVNDGPFTLVLDSQRDLA